MRKFLKPIVISTFVGSLLSLAYVGGLFAGFEQFLEDRLFSEKPRHPDIVIVAIDDASLQRQGQWPWPRSHFAQFIENLEDVAPAAVGFDVMFAEPSRSGEEDDSRLEEALARASFPIIFPVEIGDAQQLKPLPRFAQHTTLSHINVTVDPDGVVRTFPQKAEEFRPFAFEIITAAGIEIPLEHELTDRNRIVFAGKPGSFTTVSFSELLEGHSTKSLRGKILLVGATAQDLHDNKPTPVSEGEVMAGVEIHASIANMLALNYRLTNLPHIAGLLWILLAALIPLITVLFLRSFLKLFLINTLIGLAYLVVQITLFETGLATPIIHIHLAWTLSLIALIAYQYFIIDREKSEIKKLFGKYVSPKVLDQILENPAQVVLGGEERVITVLFSDIRGFTTLSERTTPTQLVQIINRYFSAMTTEILENDGVVDKYIGDAIMAFWGAPLPDEQQADKALRAALGMKEKLDIFNKELKSEIGIEINIGVGLYTGPAVVGNMGSLARFDYTAMGDTVNTSSRLEGVTKTYGVNCIIGESTKDALQSPQHYLIRELDQIVVKGKKEPRKIFEPLRGGSTPTQERQLAAFELGRDAYYAGAWHKAIEHFKKVLKEGEDGPSTVLLHRCEELVKNPPEEWAGVYEFKTK